MRSIKVFSILIAISFVCFAQRTSFDKDEITTAEFVNDSLNLNQTEIFARCLEWATETFVSSKDAIQQKDKDAGIIVIQANYDLNKGFLGHWLYRFNLKIRMKDNKIKMTFETGKMIDKKTGQETTAGYPYPSKKDLEIIMKNYSDLHDKIIAKLKVKDNF